MAKKTATRPPFIRDTNLAPCRACFKEQRQNICSVCKHAIRGNEWRHAYVSVGDVETRHARCCVEHKEVRS